MSSKVIWMDALTPKQALLFSYLAKELLGAGFRPIVTTRRHELTCEILAKHGVEHVVLGEYGGKSLYSKLLSFANRQLLLTKWLKSLPDTPLAHISFTSPDSTRVAFGLGIPSIQLTDSPHSDKVNRLTLPLATKVITPTCVSSEVMKYLVDKNTLISFEGVFEVIWVKRMSYDNTELKNLNLVPYKYCIVRPPESKAYYYAYYKDPFDLFLSLTEKLSKRITVVFYPRYQDQLEVARQMAKKEENIVVLDRAMNMQALERYAALIVTGGATLGQEAALLGTPSIIAFPKELATVRFLKEKGFPVYHEPKNFISLSLEILKDPKRYRVQTERLLEDLEDPLPLVLKTIDEITGHGEKHAGIQSHVNTCSSQPQQRKLYMD